MHKENNCGGKSEKINLKSTGVILKMKDNQLQNGDTFKDTKTLYFLSDT